MLERVSDALFKELSLYVIQFGYEKSQYPSPPTWVLPSKSLQLSFSDDDNILKYDTSFLQSG